MTKRITALFLSIVMILTMVLSAVSAYAEDGAVTLTVEASKVSAYSGDTVDYDIYLEAADHGITAFQAFIVIPEGFTFVTGSGSLNGDAADLFGNTLEFIPENNLQLLWYTSAGEGVEVASRIKLLTFKCMVSDSAVLGDNKVTLKNALWNGDSALGYGEFDCTTVPATVTVTPAPVAVTGVELSAETLALNLTDNTTATLTATVKPDNATNEAVTWASSNEAVATVDANGLVTAVGEGEAIITVTTVDGGRQDTCVVTVSKAAATVTDAPDAKPSLTYNGRAQELVTAGTANGGEMQYSLDGSTYSTTIPKGTNAGTYTVYYKVVGDANHSDSQVYSVTVTIAKADATVTAPTAKTGLTYTGRAQELVTAGTANGGEMQYSLDGSTYSTTIPKGTNAGTYTVHYKVVGDANHSDSQAASVTVTIAKADATVTAPTAKTGLTYTGRAQELVTAGTANGGEMQYSLDGSTYSTTIPKGTNAGTYTVHYKVVGDANHSDSAVGGPVEVRINKATPNVTAPTNLTATYGQTLADVDFIDPANGTWSWLDSSLSVGNVGTNEFQAKFTPNNSNYNTVEKSVTVEVGKATISDSDYTTPTGKTLTYNGTLQDLIIAGSINSDIGTMKYYVGSQPSGTFSTEMPKAQDAGTYIVWFMIDGGNNYNDVAAAPVSVTIAPAKVDKPEEDTKEYTYTGSELTYDVENNAAYTVTGNKQTNAGDYTVIVALKNGNYVWADDTTADLTYTFKINKAAATCTAPTANTLTYTGNELVLVTEGSTNDGTMKYAIGTDDVTAPTNGWDDKSPKGTDVGTYYVWYYVVGDANHNDSTPACVTVTIGAAVPGTVAVTGVALDKGTMTLTVGGTDTLTATVAPADATNKNVSWSSNNTAVATVDQTGKVTAVGVGTATITVTTVDGGFTATCAVTVNAAGGSGGGSGSGGGGHYWHYDYNSDGKCDYCGSKISCKHADANKDGYCDNCYRCMNHKDKNNDGYCDSCKNKIVESGKTFDGGLALYIGMSVAAATGSAALVVSKKRKSK